MRCISMMLLMLVTACSGQPIAPSAQQSPLPNVPDGPRVTLSGAVIDGLSRRPVEGASVQVYPLTLPPGGWGVRLAHAPSDALGSFRISNLPADLGEVWVMASLQGHRQPCVTRTTIGGSDAAIDVALVSRLNAAAANVAPPAGPGVRVISGNVYEVIDGRRRPVEDAWVGWEPRLDLVVADTSSDPDGRYALCGLPVTPIIGLFATKGGFSVEYFSADVGVSVVDVEMRRR